MSDFLEAMRERMELKDVDVLTYSPLVLAYIGDAIFDVIIRTKVVNRGNMQVQKMHDATIHYVKADAQAAMVAVLKDHLTPEELAVYKRGHNAKSHSSAKNATIQNYRKATGLEALFGYLYLTGKYERLLDLVRAGLEGYDNSLFSSEE